MKAWGYETSERHMLEELANVVEGYPVFAGDTLSHRTAEACRRAGWIVRQAEGRWIPTAAGLLRLERHLLEARR